MKHPRHWRSLDELAEASLDTALAAGPEMAAAQSADGAAEMTVDGVSRRQFIALMGASTALAGAGLEGCIRKPVEHILPFANRPEYLVPGKPVFYASSYQLGATVAGVVVENQDGRPTKIEGNPDHPASLGAASSFAQASVLGFYDPERSRTPWHKDAAISWDAAWAAFEEGIAPARASGGEGLALVVDSVMSPTHRAQLAELKRTLPKARIVLSDRLWPAQAVAGAALAAGPKAVAVPSLADAKVIVVLDGDVLVSEGDSTRHARDFATGRAVDVPKPDMNRLYVVGPVFDATAAMADHRLRVRASEVGTVLRGLVLALLDTPGVGSAPGADGLKGALGTPALDEKRAAFVKALARDMVARKGQAVVMTGERQPAWVHALAHVANSLVGADGKTVSWRRDSDALEGQSLSELKAGLDDGSVKTVVVLGANPVYDAAGDLGFAASLAKASFVAHAGLYRDETGAVAHLHLPLAHYLEAWGDVRSQSGVASLVQPLIAPLYGSPSSIELTARVATGQATPGYDIVRAFWAKAQGGSLDERAWRRWLHSGLIDVPVGGEAVTPSYGELAAKIPAAAPAADGFEAVFALDSRILDGRFANNGWLQELPDTITKLTWDNAALMSAKTAGSLGVTPGQMVRVKTAAGELELPAWVAPGVAENTVILPLGFGRKNLGSVAASAGFDVYPLTSSASAGFSAATVVKGAGFYDLAVTQTHDRMEPGFDYPARPLVREATIDHFREEPRFVEKAEIMAAEKIRSPFKSPEFKAPQQWGMSIDLNACTGCNACTMACNAENNIPVVGKAQVLKGREMHWIRIDRYYVGNEPDEPQAVVQPVGCQQCETAPCETVCPVAATTHSPDGLNDMAYNRCVGTRYCANNCPFKVRRFNFFNFNLDIDPVAQMQKNPDVTIRFRGVMEKCTYCTQRISEAKIAAKVAGTDVVADGTIQTACQQTCPTGAIVFGDVLDPNSRVSRQKASPRNYVMLRELNLVPRTSYLARIRNPNPELV
ncbi:MAG: 4Fe-4S dicluster domain-containing protein [Myxococcota bacterium]